MSVKKNEFFTITLPKWHSITRQREQGNICQIIYTNIICVHASFAPLVDPSTRIGLLNQGSPTQTDQPILVN